MATERKKDSRVLCEGSGCPAEENGVGNDTGHLPWFLRILNEDWGDGVSIPVTYTDEPS